MKAVKSNLFLLFIFLFVSSLKAQENEMASNKYREHGGVLKSAGKYKIEMAYNPAVKTDPVVFYITDTKGMPVSNKGLTAKAEFLFADGATETPTLMPLGENGFSAKLSDNSKAFTCTFTLQLSDKAYTASFKNIELKQNTTAAKYVCPMHADITSDKPGKCSKCGMALEKKD